MGPKNYKKRLHQKAKAILERNPGTFPDMSKKEAFDLFEELHIHQIEIELQNEELMAIQRALEDSRARYINLFNNAPVGYVILDRVGMISHCNATFLNMVPGLGIKKDGQAFADLLIQEDGDAFRARFRALYKSPQGKQIQARVRTEGPAPFHVLLEARHLIEKPGAHPVQNADELLLTVTDITELQATKEQFKSALHDVQAGKNITESLLMAARSILEQTDFQTTARQIFDTCSKAIGSRLGYLALLSESRKEDEVLFLKESELPCAPDKNLCIPVRGIGAKAYQTGEVIYNNSFAESEWASLLPKGHIRLENVLVAPLVIESSAVGVMSLANKADPFTENDARIAQGFCELVAIALKNDRLREKQDRAEQEKERLIRELREALANVKTLSGLIPICSHCKKIRDDQGYWNRLEDYLDEHSDARLSHGICRDCAKEHYPDFKLYDDDGDPS